MTGRKHIDEEQSRPSSAAPASDEPAGRPAPSGAGKADAGQAAADRASGQPAAADPLASLAVERDEYLDHLQRLTAEFDNYRKRVRRDTEELRLRAAEGVVESLLPVMDNMQRALRAAEEHEEGQLIQGVELVSGQLSSVMASHGLEQVQTEVGAPFDPTVHEAVLTQPSDEFEEGSIARVLEPGYLLHGRLLRAAKVIVVQ
jgi:molecular chaperone GrpE